MTRYGVVLFPTTSYAIRAERRLLGRGHSIKLIPTPREFSSDCGIALRFDWAQLELVLAGLMGAGIEVEAVHPWEERG